MPMKFELDRAGVRALLNSPGVAADVARRARQIASTAGPDWETESGLSIKGDRVATVVFTNDPKAIRRNLRDHTLMRSIDAGRN